MAVEDFKGDSLRQRLVGGVALLVIGVIAWFWLLSADSPVDPVSRTSQIPPAPDIQPFSVPEPTPPADVAPINNAQESPAALRADIDAEKPAAVTSSVPNRTANNPPKPVPPKAQATVEKAPVSISKEAKPKESKSTETKSSETKSVETKQKETFELDQNGLPIAWVVQAGLFSTQASADKVKATLQQKGFKAYTEAYKTSSAPNGFKVFVGPKLSRERADEQKHAIDAVLKVNSKVVRFQPPQR